MPENIPPIGTVVISPNGSEMTLVGHVPYTRKDGAPSAVLHWQRECCVCGVRFDISTGLNWKTHNASRRCPEHRMTREEWIDICRKKGEASRAAKKTLQARRKAEKAAQKEAKQAALAQMRRAPNPLGHPRRKLSDEDVAEIRRLSAEGLSSKDLAVVFPVSDSAVRNILRGARRG